MRASQFKKVISLDKAAMLDVQVVAVSFIFQL